MEDLEEYCTIIVRVVKENSGIPMIQMQNGKMISEYAFSQVEVTEIYKDLTNELSQGDSIRILENEVFSEHENVIYHVGGYNMIEKQLCI